MFKQNFYYYKFNLKLGSFDWYGTRACKKRNLKSPQWLRNIKSKKYPIWRIDIFFSNMKYNNIHYVENGGWHFTNIKSPEEIEKKLLNYTHHYEFEQSGLTIDDLRKKILEKNELIFFKCLNKIGFQTRFNIKKSKYQNKLIEAFQRRFRPELISGIIDKECFFIAKNIGL